MGLQLHGPANLVDTVAGAGGFGGQLEGALSAPGKCTGGDAGLSKTTNQ